MRPTSSHRSGADPPCRRADPGSRPGVGGGGRPWRHPPGRPGRPRPPGPWRPRRRPGAPLPCPRPGPGHRRGRRPGRPTTGGRLRGDAAMPTEPDREGHARRRLGFATRAVHSVRPPGPEERPLAVPIWQTSTFTFDDAEHYAHTLHQPREGFVYTRYENPTSAALEATVAGLEGAAQGMATASWRSGPSTAAPTRC